MPYGTLNGNLEKLESFPPIDAAKWEKEINKIFTPYVFFRKSKSSIEIWSSCCGEHRTESWIKKLMLPGDYEIRGAWHNGSGHCPYCGRSVTYKEFGRLGKKKKLREYRPAVILSASGGDLYARAYWCLKDYESLTAPPTVYATSFYRFSAREHSAEEIIYPEDDCISRIQKETYKVNQPAICEPFTTDNWCFTSYTPYTVLNLDEIEKSDFRYCQYQTFKQHHDWAREGNTERFLMRFLTIAAIYPDKVEMLIKSGLWELVGDLVDRRKKHSAWFNWDAKDFKRAFKNISRQQLREIAELEMRMDDVDLWAKVREQGITLPELHELCAKDYRTREIIQTAIRNKIKVHCFLHYLQKQGGKKGRIDQQFVFWKDYVDMAGKLGWSIKVETVLMPPNLRARHDEALAETNARRAREKLERQQSRIGKLEELREKNEKKMVARRRKYNIESGGYCIRIAETGEEIIREGATLGHCVGGYAERHLAGATTILFLRRTETPEASLYTIEMDGNTMRQIHGFKNDACTPPNKRPRVAMAWLLDPWLDWLKQGSPRDKDGCPILQTNEEMRQEVQTA